MGQVYGNRYNVNKIAPHTEGAGTDPSKVTELIQPNYYMKFTPARVAQARLRKTLSEQNPHQVKELASEDEQLEDQ